MFGLVVADITQLDAKSAELYRGAYCGLCSALSRRHGSAMRLTLNYEMTFLALFLSSVYGVPPEKNFKRCGVHPVKPQLCLSSEIIDYAADMNVALSYHNAMDNWSDDKNPFSLAAARAMRGEYRKVSSKYPRQCGAIEKCMEALAAAERCGDPVPDNAAGAFGELLAEIFIWQEDALSEKLRHFGYALGSAVYIMDAAVDIRSDLKHKRYNPLAFISADREEILNTMMARCTAAYEELCISDYKDIFDNILYSGIWSKYRYKKRNGVKHSGKGSV